VSRLLDAPRTRPPLLACGLALALIGGCAGGSPDDAAHESQDRAAPPVIEVGVVAVIKAPIQDETSFLGELRSMHTVDLRAQVSGTVTKQLFTEGAKVKRGDKLFKIDDRPLKAALAKAKAELAKTKAERVQADADLNRATALKAESALSQREFQKFKANADTRKAGVSAALAAVQSAQIDLSYATIEAPIDGTIGLVNTKVGNIVDPAAEEPLARITQLDPIHIYVSASERFYLSAARAYKELKAKGIAQTTYELRLKLADDTIYEHLGDVDFISHEIDTKTGTFEIRAVFPNPDRLLRPGQYGELLVANSKPVDRLLIPRKAIVKRQAGAFVYVVASDGAVESRKVELGSIHGVLQVVGEGLDEGETIVVNGLQKVREGARVTTRALPPITPPPPPVADPADAAADDTKASATKTTSGATTASKNKAPRSRRSSKKSRATRDAK
jgi:RND family efflux transporter MFP subunit